MALEAESPTAAPAADPQAAFAALLAQAGARRQRGMLLISGGREAAFRLAQQLLQGSGLSAVHWFSKRAPQGAAASHGQAALGLLGCEHDALVFDAWSGFDPDAFGALSGTVRGGGVLILLAPVLEQWRDFPDPLHARITVAPWTPEQVSGHYLARLARILEAEPGLLWIEQGRVRRQPSLPPPVPVSADTVAPPCRTPDQQRAVDAVVRVVTGHRRRPVVLSSDRGRGKSAAFGIAAAQLIAAGRDRILLTAPRRAAVEAVIAHARALAPAAEHALRFIPPDELVRTPQPADLLLVDEAAAIPAPLLETLLKRYARIAFATTVHGYEGTGRGFALRFSRLLDRHSNSWKTLTLETPVRWAAGDPLERLVFRLLALDTTLVPDTALEDADPATARIERLDRAELAQDEATLSALFGLLVQAHYRTRPMDLRHLLDGPNLSVCVVRLAGQVAATALVADEGGFDAAEAQAIWSGQRRPHGHLLPETLAAHQGLLQAPQLQCARIIRIAVHPALQRRGLGRRLVEHISAQARAAGQDYIGTSFGATPELLDFWHDCGWFPVRVGIHRGASSGMHSVVMLQALNPAGTALVAEAGERFLAQFPHQLGDSLRDLESALVVRLLRQAQFSMPAPQPADRDDIEAFARHRRQPESVIGALWRLACHALGEGRDERLDATERELLVLRILQRHDWPACARRLGLDGHAEALSRLRAAVGKLAG